jgi:hypothetical protein
VEAHQEISAAFRSPQSGINSSVYFRSSAWLGRLGINQTERSTIRLTADFVRTASHLPVCQRLLKTSPWQILVQPHQVFLGVCHTLVVRKGGKLAPKIIEKESCLDFAQLQLQFFAEETSDRLHCFGLLFFRERQRHMALDLTRIRPNNCAFKDVFFGSNPLASLTIA